jgi:hypothetical protein
MQPVRAGGTALLLLLPLTFGLPTGAQAKGHSSGGGASAGGGHAASGGSSSGSSSSGGHASGGSAPAGGSASAGGSSTSHTGSTGSSTTTSTTGSAGGTISITRTASGAPAATGTVLSLPILSGISITSGGITPPANVIRRPPGNTNPGQSAPAPSVPSAPTAAAAAPTNAGFTLSAPSSGGGGGGGNGGGGGGATSGGSPDAAPLPTPGTPIVTNTKLGVGLYGGVPIDTLRTMRPAVFLLEDPDQQAARDLRATFPKALIVGRRFVPDGDGSLANCQDGAEDHEAKGAAFADTISRTAVPLKGIIDAWVSDNEQAVATDRASLPCHAQFQSGFVQRLQGTYGIDAVAGNDAAGALEPSDYVTYFSRPISQAAYFGLHAYGKPAAGTLQSTDNIYYALRYRLVHDALQAAGVPMPPKGFLLTETGLYDGWRGAVNDDLMAGDFLWLEQHLEEDAYMRGQMIFGLGLGNRFWNFDLQSTNVPGLLGAFDAQHAGS